MKLVEIRNSISDGMRSFASWGMCVVVRVCALSWCCGGVVCPFKTTVSIQNVPVCTFRTSPCVPAPRAHVFQHARVLPAHTEAFLTYTRARFESAHGGFEWTHHTATAPRQRTHTTTHTTHQNTQHTTAYQNFPT